MCVQALGQEDPLDEVMAAHSSIVAWRIPWTEEPGGLKRIPWTEEPGGLKFTELQSQTRLKQLSTGTPAPYTIGFFQMCA